MYVCVCIPKPHDFWEIPDKFSAQPMNFQNLQKGTNLANLNDNSQLLQDYSIQVQLLINDNYVIETTTLFDNPTKKGLRGANNSQLVIRIKLSNIQNQFSDTFFITKYLTKHIILGTSFLNHLAPFQIICKE